MSPETFRDVLGRFVSGVTVVTTRDPDGRDRGMTVSAFSSLSLRPPLVLACIGHDATIAGSVAAADHLGISVLAADQAALALKFADPLADRFDGVSVTRGALGVAFIAGALAHLECRIVARHEDGDHTIVVGEVLGAAARDGQPLTWFRGGVGSLDG